MFRHKISQVLLGSVLVLSYPGAGLASDSSTAEEEYTYLVGFENQVNVEVIEESGGEPGEVWDRIDAAAATMTSEEAAFLSAQEDIAYVELNNKVEITSDLPPLENWGLEHLDIPEAWDTDFSGEGVDVAVIDSGIDETHPSLTITDGFSAIPGSDSYHDDNGHGTHAAGIIAANHPSKGLVGVAPNVDLYAVKVLDGEGIGAINQIVKGMDWAIEQDVDIINLSLGTLRDSATMEAMVEEAHENDIIVVAAAGNLGEGKLPEGRVEFPARYDSTIAVGAVDDENERAYFSATGEAVEIAAPGVDIVSTFKDSKYGALSGTSMAAPFVTGSLALMKEAYPDASASELRSILHNEAVDLGEKGRDAHYGYGLLQLPDLSEEAPIQEGEHPLEERDEPKEEPTEEVIEERPGKEDPAPTPNQPLPVPAGVEGQVVYNDGGANVQLFWDRPEQENITAHRIYKDGNLEKEVLNTTVFKDEEVEHGEHVYQVSAVDMDGNESEKSAPVQVVVEEAAFNWPDKMDTPPSFEDVSAEHWALTPIEKLSLHGIIKGKNGKFLPNDEVSRGQAMTMIGRLMEWEANATSTRFPDVDEDYFAAGFIEHAVDADYIKGFKDGTFRPNDHITRAQMAAILGNVFDLHAPSLSETQFTDVDKDTTGYKAIAYLANEGLIKGYDDGTYRPNEPITRAQFASIFYNLGEYLTKNNPS